MSPPRPNTTPPARWNPWPVAWLAMLALACWWGWQQPFMHAPRTLWALWRMPPPTDLPLPVQGVRAGDVADTWGGRRGAGRRHEGTDIFARRGTPVLSATLGVVIAVRESGLGGRQVWVTGPGRERHYYAHLDDWALGIRVGDVVSAGELLGTVGDTGNARGTPPHLHYGIYGAGGALDPLPRLRAHSPGGDTATPATSR